MLAQSAADQRVEPASLTKLMTAYAVFKALEDGRISLDDEAPVSVKAWRTGGTRMFIDVNSQVRVEDLIRGMLIQSGNDASVALAEFISGSVDAFVDSMNAYAAALGMQQYGLPKSHGLAGAQPLQQRARHGDSREGRDRGISRPLPNVCRA